MGLALLIALMFFILVFVLQLARMLVFLRSSSFIQQKFKFYTGMNKKVIKKKDWQLSQWKKNSLILFKITRTWFGFKSQKDERVGPNTVGYCKCYYLERVEKLPTYALQMGLKSLNSKGNFKITPPSFEK